MHDDSLPSDETVDVVVFDVAMRSCWASTLPGVAGPLQALASTPFLLPCPAGCTWVVRVGRVEKSPGSENTPFLYGWGHFCLTVSYWVRFGLGLIHGGQNIVVLFSSIYQGRTIIVTALTVSLLSQ